METANQESQRPKQDVADTAKQSPTSTLFEGNHFFSEDEELPWKHIDNLGRGGFGSVDRVQHVHSGQILARKILRYHPRQAKRVKMEFNEEISHLKKLNQHKHIVRLVCSYQQGCNFGLVMLPVAPGNLYDFLRKRVPDGEQKCYARDLQQSFGCLLSGLLFIHSNGIRHKDIKPQNILVDPQSSSKYLFTDFGLSRDFSDLSHSYTSGRPDAFSSRYSAPEVAAYTKRGRKADIFSLGCVFVETMAVLSGSTPDQLENAVLTNVGDEQAESMSFGTHLAGINRWICQKRTRLPGELVPLHIESPIFTLCELMIKKKPSDRPHLDTLFRLLAFNNIRDARKVYFCRSCSNEITLQLEDLDTQCGAPHDHPQSPNMDELRLQICKIVVSHTDPSDMIREIGRYTEDASAMDLRTIAEVIFEAALEEPAENFLNSDPTLSRYAEVLKGLTSTPTISESSSFQPQVIQLCMEQFKRSWPQEFKFGVSQRRRNLRYMELLGRLIRKKLVPTDYIRRFLDSMLFSVFCPIESFIEKLAVFLVTVGSSILELPKGQELIELCMAKLWNLVLSDGLPTNGSTRPTGLMLELLLVAQNGSWQAPPCGWLVNIYYAHMHEGLFTCQFYPCGFKAPMVYPYTTYYDHTENFHAAELETLKTRTLKARMNSSLMLTKPFLEIPTSISNMESWKLSSA